MKKPCQPWELYGDRALELVGRMFPIIETFYLGWTAWLTRMQTLTREREQSQSGDSHSHLSCRSIMNQPLLLRRKRDKSEETGDLRLGYCNVCRVSVLTETKTEMTARAV